MASEKRQLKEDDDNNDQLNTMGDDEFSSRLRAKKKKIVFPKGVNEFSSRNESKKKEGSEANTLKDNHPPTAEVQPEGSGSYSKQSSPAEGLSVPMAASTSNQSCSGSLNQQGSSSNSGYDQAPLHQSRRGRPRKGSLNQQGSSSNSGYNQAPLHQSRRGRPRKGSLNQQGSSSNSGFNQAPLRQSRRGRSRKGSLNQPGLSSNPASVAPSFQQYFDLNQPASVAPLYQERFDLNQLPSVAPLYQERFDLNQPASVSPFYQQHFDLNQPASVPPSYQFLPCYDSLNQPGLSSKSGSNQASSCQLPPRFGSPYQPGSSLNPAFSRDAAYQLQALQQHQPFNPNVNTLPSAGAVGFLQGGSNAFALLARDSKDAENKGDFGKTTGSVTVSTSGNIAANDKSNRPVVSTAGQVLSATNIDRSSSSTESDKIRGYKKNADTSQKGNTRRKKRSSRRRYFTDATRWNWLKFFTGSHKRYRRVQYKKQVK